VRGREDPAPGIEYGRRLIVHTVKHSPCRAIVNFVLASRA